MEAMTGSGLIIEDGFDHQSGYPEALPLDRECFLFFVRFISLFLLSSQLCREVDHRGSLAGSCLLQDFDPQHGLRDESLQFRLVSLGRLAVVCRT